jgi:hypothetical protein
MTSRKSLFVLALSLILAAFSTLNAQTRLPKATVTLPVPNGSMTAVSDDEVAKLNLRELSADDLKDFGITNNLSFATVYTTATCGPLPVPTGGFAVPLGTCLSSTPASFRSFRFGCTRTIIFPAAGCAAGGVAFTGFPQDACIQFNPPILIGSIACVTP